MAVTTTLKYIGIDEAAAVVDSGGAFVDLRPTASYLELHIPGSIALLYEFGPGMATRARDCLPLDLPLVLMDLGVGEVVHAAASLRGKGFAVVGAVEDAINEWIGRGKRTASTEVLRSGEPPVGTLLDVGDPGATSVEGAQRIPVEVLWQRVHDVRGSRINVIAGYGVRAALAVGILERAGHHDISFWESRSRRA